MSDFAEIYQGLPGKSISTKTVIFTAQLFLTQ